MARKPPASYAGLAPFAEWFRQGVAVLMYHKLGPRPAGTRLKGLYLSRRLFARQLAELARAGFVTAAPAQALLPQSAATPRIVLSFDDGYVNVLRYGLPTLAAHGFFAVQFLVADHLGGYNAWDTALGEAPERLMDDGQVREWLAAGQRIGSHTLSHPRLTRLAPQRAREEILASKKKLEDRFGVAVEDFCYPYGDWNPRVAELVAEAGYRTACTTEYGVNTPQSAPLALKRVMARYRSWSLEGLRQRLARG